PRSLRQWRSLEFALSSELIRVEALRTIDRARIQLRLDDSEVAERRAAIGEVLSSFHLAKFDGTLLDRVSDPFPTLLGTLDAVHLTTALMARGQHGDLFFATHDGALATAARSVGFRVIGVPARSA